jgi:hypothetical protein
MVKVVFERTDKAPLPTPGGVVWARNKLITLVNTTCLTFDVPRIGEHGTIQSFPKTLRVGDTITDAELDSLFHQLRGPRETRQIQFNIVTQR